MIRKCLTVVIVLGLCSSAAEASSMTYGFTRITQNNIENVEAQLSLQIVDAAGNPYGAAIGALDADEVLFLFRNNVGVASSISEVYLDDGTILGLSAVYNSLGGFTDFVGGPANPDNLPSGNNVAPPFVATSSFSADAQGNPSLGVDQAIDVLGIVYQLQGGQGFDDVVAAFADGSLRAGLHLRAIGSAGDSDSFVNTGDGDVNTNETVVPEPGTMILLAAGLLGLFTLRKRLRS